MLSSSPDLVVTDNDVYTMMNDVWQVLAKITKSLISAQTRLGTCMLKTLDKS